MTIIVDLQVATALKSLPAKERFQEWVELVLQGNDKNSGKDSDRETELSIRLVDENESQTLNHDYRGKDYPTNVLSFPMDIPEGIPVNLLGDLVICAPVVIKEAQEQNKTEEAHWAHLVIHGTLHLLGYDHIDDAQAEQMESLEIQLIQSLGYPNPYLEPSE
jgi:probable rRNA maturation factor